MFDLPKDIEYKLKQKYPELNISKIFNDILDEILNKTFEDSACTIRKFGKFTAYQIYSTRLGYNTCKFKFIPSPTFNKKIAQDQYLLNNLPVKETRDFTSEHEEKCQNFQEQKQLNIQLKKEARNTEKTRTKEKLAKMEIMNILSEDEE